MLTVREQSRVPRKPPKDAARRIPPANCHHGTVVIEEQWVAETPRRKGLGSGAITWMLSRRQHGLRTLNAPEHQP